MQFVAADGRRPSIRLGPVTARQAQSAKRFIEDLIACKVSGEPPKGTTAEWIAGLPHFLRRRLERVGLLAGQERQESPALGAWLDQCIEQARDAKPGTRFNLTLTTRKLKGFFGADTALDEITANAADGFRVHLRADEELAEATVRRHCKRARQFFRAACRAKLIEDNPFSEVPCTDFANEARRRFVSREDIERVLEICPTRWKVVFALCRFGGLRCPTEVRALRWGDVLWDRGRFTVTSVKTEGHDKATRTVPLFPRLREILLAAFEEAADGAEYVAEVLQDGRDNPRTPAMRYIRRAGMEPWPRLFQNLRASLETELSSEFPIQTVTSWLGNTPAVAMAHYLSVRETDFQKAVRNPVQQDAAQARTTPQDLPVQGAEPALCVALRDDANPCNDNNLQQLTPRGFEPRSRA